MNNIQLEVQKNGLHGYLYSITVRLQKNTGQIVMSYNYVQPSAMPYELFKLLKFPQLSYCRIINKN